MLFQAPLSQEENNFLIVINFYSLIQQERALLLSFAPGNERDKLFSWDTVTVTASVSGQEASLILVPYQGASYELEVV
jgi:hypothetical protein